MTEYLTPGVYAEPAAPSRRIQPLRTDIAAFVGIAQRGPLDDPRRVESWEEFRAVFGEAIANGYLAYAAKAFFENGGRTAYPVRVAARSVVTVTTEVFSDRRSARILSTDGFVPGAVVTVRQGSACRSHLLTSVDRGGFLVSWERPLEPELDIARPMQVETGAAAASGLLPGSDGKKSLRIEASSPGQWGNRLAVHLARSNRAATRLAPLPQAEEGSRSFVESVSGFARGSLVRLFRALPAPKEEHRVVVGVDPFRKALSWDRPLDAGFRARMRPIREDQPGVEESRFWMSNTIWNTCCE